MISIVEAALIKELREEYGLWMHLEKSLMSDKFGQDKPLLLTFSILMLLNIGKICSISFIKNYTSMESGLI